LITLNYYLRILPAQVMPKKQTRIAAVINLDSILHLGFLKKVM